MNFIYRFLDYLVHSKESRSLINFAPKQGVLAQNTRAFGISPHRAMIELAAFANESSNYTSRASVDSVGSTS